VSRVDIYGRILIGSHHLDVRADYHDGPVPCIAQRVRFLDDELLPATLGMIQDVTAHVAEECTTCGCARVRCEQSPERFGSPRCCIECDH
jgi:hypothetical protein